MALSDCEDGPGFGIRCCSSLSLASCQGRGEDRMSRDETRRDEMRRNGCGKESAEFLGV